MLIRGDRGYVLMTHAGEEAVLTVLKNGLAWVLLAFGLVLSVPGVPGQGLLTIMVGLLLADFPGKRGLERRLVRVHAVHSVANKIRARFGKPPLQGLD